jgi:hypothetical protein
MCGQDEADSGCRSKRSEAVTETNIRVVFLWDVTRHSMRRGYRRFGGYTAPLFSVEDVSCVKFDVFKRRMRRLLKFGM